MHALPRFPRGQDLVSYGRLVTCAKEAAAKRSGTSGKQIGQASRKWACSEAAGLFLRHPPAGPKFRAQVAHRHGQGPALTGLAHQLARAVDAMRTRHTVVDMETCLHR